MRTVATPTKRPGVVLGETDRRLTMLAEALIALRLAAVRARAGVARGGGFRFRIVAPSSASRAAAARAEMAALRRRLAQQSSTNHERNRP